MSGGKIIPVIAQGDREVSENLHSALVSALAASDAAMLAAVGKLVVRIDELKQRVERLEQGGGGDPLKH